MTESPPFCCGGQKLSMELKFLDFEFSKSITGNVIWKSILKTVYFSATISEHNYSSCNHFSMQFLFPAMFFSYPFPFLENEYFKRWFTWGMEGKCKS